MTYATALSLGREAIVVALLVCGPALILGLVTGLVISIFQAVTQMLTDFMQRVFNGIPEMVK